MSQAQAASAVPSLATMSGAEIAVGLSAGTIGLTSVVAHLGNRLLPPDGQAAVYGAVAASNPAVLQAVIVAQAALQQAAAAKGGKAKKEREFAFRSGEGKGKRQVSVDVTADPSQANLKKGDPLRGWCLSQPAAAWLLILSRADEIRAVCEETMRLTDDSLAAEVVAKNS